jgi:hypothetical protein
MNLLTQQYLTSAMISVIFGIKYMTASPKSKRNDAYRFEIVTAKPTTEKCTPHINCWRKGNPILTYHY